MALFGAALFLIFNSIDRIGMIDDATSGCCLCSNNTPSNNAYISLALDLKNRASAKAWGKMLGALVAGSLLESSGRVGRCRIRWLEYWVALNMAALFYGLFCILRPFFSRSCTSEGTPSINVLTTRVLGDPDCICASLAQDTFDIDVDIC